MKPSYAMKTIYSYFEKRLLEKVHSTIPKGIVGGFKFTVLQRNWKELVRKAVEMCLRVLKESNKSRFDRYSRQKQCIDHIPYYLSGSVRATTRSGYVISCNLIGSELNQNIDLTAKGLSSTEMSNREASTA